MNAAVLTSIKGMEISDIPTPKLMCDTDVLIRITHVGVCGSDVHYYTTGRIGSQVVKYPFPVGHEAAGVVEQIGKRVTHVKVGDNVAIEPAMPCYQCDQCQKGREHTCRKLKFLGCPGQADGCLSDQIVMPETSCIKIPDNVTLQEAALSEPLSIGVYAVKQSIPMKNAKVGILGFGPIGFSVMYPALLQGAESVYVTDKLDYRLELAKQCGARWTGNTSKTNIVEEITKQEPLLLDVVFECCGQQEALDQAIDLLKPGGKLMLVGIPETDRISFSIDLLRRKEITIYNVRRQNHCVEEALEMISSRKLDVNKMVTHHFPLSKTKDAFDLVMNYDDKVMKAMILL